MGGFEPAPVESSELPSQLLTDMQARISGACQTEAKAALGAPPPPSLIRNTSILGDSELQNGDLVLTAIPVGRHVFKVRFRLAGGRQPESHYVLLVPRLATAASGHARYLDHSIRLQCHESRSNTCEQPEVIPFGSFVVANVPGSTIDGLVLEHEFTSCRVRVQLRQSTCQQDIVPAPELSSEERAVHLADDFEQAQRIREMLGSQGLARRPRERDIAFAVRLGRALCDGYKYDVAITEANLQKLPTLIWEKHRGDCSAFNAGFAYALRAFGVPARVSLGFKYGHAVKQACGSFVATHAQAAFFAEGIGWVPCDATLGVRRLGHEAGSQLSFLEWRPAVQSLAEVEELAHVFKSPSDRAPANRRLRKTLEEIGHGKPMPVRALASGLARTEGLSMDAAELRSAQVLSLCGFDAEEEISAEEFVRGIASVDLGKFKELGMEGCLNSTAQAGAKFYEGGPYKKSPLDLSSLAENMMVMDGIERVMEHVGCSQGLRQEAADWSRMWPYGVFLCTYSFEERPVASSN